MLSCYGTLNKLSMRCLVDQVSGDVITIEKLTLPRFQCCLIFAVIGLINAIVSCYVWDSLLRGIVLVVTFLCEVG